MFWRNVNEFYCRIWPRVRREGICTVPLEGPVIVAANHHSTLDPFLLTATSPNRYVSFMIAREFAEIPGFSRLVQMIECVPVSRSRIDTASVRAALRHLASGRAVGIFPQGRVQHPDEPPELREGVGLLALRSGATVIPAYISNTRYSPSVIVPFLRRHRAVVRYGKPVDLSRWQGREKDREAYREASEEILRAIFALRPPSEPEQVRA
jgi:1-acyl-sn-glycerol-3-phosphate acyltransferase